MQSNEDNIEGFIEQLNISFSKLEELLSLLFSVPKQELSQKLTPFEVSKINVMVGYAINALFFGL
jgi:hypothetical protein